MSALNVNESQWYSYLQRKTRQLLQADPQYCNHILQLVASIHNESHQNLNVDLPRVEVHRDSASVELFDRNKLIAFLKKLQLTINTPHYVTFTTCSDTEARRIASVVSSILRNQSFVRNFGRACCVGSLSTRWISIKELMGLVVFASASRGLFFADCSQYESHLELDAPLQ